MLAPHREHTGNCNLGNKGRVTPSYPWPDAAVLILSTFCMTHPIIIPKITANLSCSYVLFPTELYIQTLVFTNIHFVLVSIKYETCQSYTITDTHLVLCRLFGDFIHDCLLTDSFKCGLHICVFTNSDKFCN